MKNKIYSYFFYEFVQYFAVVLFAAVAIIWTIQAVNYLDLVTDDGHAFGIYMVYSFLALPKVITKLIPFTFLITSILTILKFEKDNELIILWSSGLNKIHIVNLIFRISLIFMFIQLVMTSTVTPKTLNISRGMLKNSELQFIPSLLKEKQFNDNVKGLTIFVDKKNEDGSYENIFIRDDGKVLTQVSSGSSTIFAKSGYVTKDEKSLILLNGNIQKIEKDGDISIIKFEKTGMELSGLSTNTIGETKIQETSTIRLVNCILKKNILEISCNRNRENLKSSQIEFNKRFGMPIFLPLIALLSCFLLLSKKESKISAYYKYIYFILAFLILVISEITVRYSGNSLNHTATYYLIPIALLPLVYLLLIKTFKYENLN